jgi:ribosome-binding protein aMBF1 (putative translation factor)
MNNGVTGRDIERTLDVLDRLPTMVATTRAECGQSLRVAAKEIDISYAHLHRVEQGTHPMGEDLIRKLLVYVREHHE